MLRILVLIAVLIVYGSLFPFDFFIRTMPDGPWALALGARPVADRFFLRDVAVNVALYFPLGAAAVLALGRKRGTALRLALAVALGLGLSFAVEFAQVFDRGRTPSVIDWIANGAGTALGALFAEINRETFERLLSRRAGRGASAPGAALLAALWVLHQLYPLFPNLSRSGVTGRIRLLLGSPCSIAGVAAEAAWWLGAAALVRAVFPKRARFAFAALLLLIPARLLVAGRGPAPADVLGAAAAALVVFAIPRAASPWPAAAAMLGALLIRGLAPYSFEAAHGFSWLPFAATLESDWGSAAHILLRKAYEYGAPVWMLAEAGVPWAGATAAAAALTGAVEIAQIWLPGRSAEVTDPLLALAMAFVLRQTRQTQRRR